MSDGFDRRVTPARGDLAAAHLRGRVAAERFAEGCPRQVCTAIAPLRFTPDEAARQESELLYGESFTLFEERDGWAWGQAAIDRYVGYVPAACLTAELRAPTHMVTALKTHLYPAPDLKQPVRDGLSFGSRVAVIEVEGKFARLASGDWAVAGHLAPLDHVEPDFLKTAARFLGVPYLWGGRSADGLDCSALVQLALLRAGIAVPRDSDQQAASVGVAVDLPSDPSALRRGDLVFFPGHVGFMLDDGDFLHANAFEMQVSVHRFADVLDRVRRLEGGDVTAVRRLPPPGQ